MNIDVGFDLPLCLNKIIISSPGFIIFERIPAAKTELRISQESEAASLQMAYRRSEK
jgi:hypothetical protein